jgi:ribosomal protein L14E/L6E/L27E
MSMDHKAGQIVKSLAGHDKDSLYMIVRAEGNFIWAVDGMRHKLEDPKKKNIRHVQLIKQYVPDEERNTDVAIQHFLKSYGGN